MLSELRRRVDLCSIRWLLGLALCASLMPTAANACKCDLPPLGDRFANATFVIVGSLSRTQIVSGPQRRYYRGKGHASWIEESRVDDVTKKLGELRVETPEHLLVWFSVVESLKGAFEAAHPIQMDPTSCGVRAEEGAIYVVYVDQNWTTDMCHGTRQVADPEADKELKQLRHFAIRLRSNSPAK